MKDILKSKLVSIALLLFFLLLSGYIWLIFAAGSQLRDFDFYLLGAKRLLNKENIYILDILPTGKTAITGYIYPPILAWLLTPLVSISYESAKLFWCSLSYVSALCSVAILASLLVLFDGIKLPYLTRLVIIGFFFLCFEPVSSTILEGQVNLFIFLLILLLLGCETRNYGFIGGICLSIAFLVKLSPALLLLPMLWFGRFQTLVGFIIGSVIIVLFTIAAEPYTLTAFSDYLSFFPVLASGDLHLSQPFNFSPYRIAANYLSGSEAVLKILFVAAGGAALLSFKKKDRASLIRAYGIFIALMTLLSPVLWYHHFTWILIPLCLAAALPVRDSNDRMKMVTLYLGIYLVLSQASALQLYIYENLPSIADLVALLPACCIILCGYILFRGQCIHEKKVEEAC